MSVLSPLARKGISLAIVGASLALMAAPAEAQWRHRRHHRGAGVAAAIGGLAAGALIAGAASRAYAAPAYGYGGGYSYAPVYSAPTSYYYDAGPSYYAPAYATPTHYAPARHRVTYRRHAAYREPVCHISRKRVWLDSHTYTFKRVTRCN